MLSGTLWSSFDVKSISSISSEEFSEIYWHSWLQALFVTVFLTSVDLLCETSYKSSSLQGYFGCFLSKQTVGCCNINFSSLSQARREKLRFARNVSIFLFYFFCDCSCLDATFGQLFTLRPRIFFFALAPLFMLIACWKTNIFRMFVGNYWEKNGEKEFFRLNRFPFIKAKSYFLHSAPL